MDELLAAVDSYAVTHYGDGAGWDYIVETYDRDELVEIITEAGATDAAAAIEAVRERAALHAMAEAEVRSTIW